jgi:hypothetical protein
MKQIKKFKREWSGRETFSNYIFSNDAKVKQWINNEWKLKRFNNYSETELYLNIYNDKGEKFTLVKDKNLKF